MTSSSTFIHLHVHTEYSFLDGGSAIDTLVHRAAELGMERLAITDHDGLYGAVKFAVACRSLAPKPIFGAELTLEDESHLTLLAETRAGYAALCRLITRAHAAGSRLNPRLPWEDLLDEQAHIDGLICLSGCRNGLVPRLIRARRFDDAADAARRLHRRFGPSHLFLELQDDLTPGSHSTCRTLAELAEQIGVGVVATNNVHYATHDDMVAHDLLCRIRGGLTVADIDPSLPLNAERYLKTAAEMRELFRWCPAACDATLRIAERCASDAVPIADEHTDAVTPRWVGEDETITAPEELRARAYRGARERYGTLLSPALKDRLEQELFVIIDMGYADYFLLVEQIVAWARRQKIRATGRGSAADSCVAYCLYLTDVDVMRIQDSFRGIRQRDPNRMDENDPPRQLPFARFLHEGKVPDIDVDFPSDRREEVFQHIIDTYGFEHVARVCTFFTFGGRSAVRDVGKALALPASVLEFLSDRIHHFARADTLVGAFDKFAELREHRALLPRFQLLFELCRRIAGFPRHLSSHSSGVVISRVPLDTIAPVEASATGILPIWTLDKDDAETVGAIKFDVLALRMLSAVADAEKAILQRDSGFRYDDIPDDDTATYELLQSGKALGAFQFQSAAQLSLAVTLQPEEFHHLVAAVALIRPGPVRGRAVERYVAGRHKVVQADIHPELTPILKDTFGCIIFQEQVDQVIEAVTGLSLTGAEKFRKSLARHTRMDTLDEAEREFRRYVARRKMKLPPERIPPWGVDSLWQQISGWGGFGFLEGHAAAFALTGYRTAYLSHYHTAEFFSGMMNNQPMGYYSNNSLAAELRRQEVAVLPVDINASAATCIAAHHDESPDGIAAAAAASVRLGLNLVYEVQKEDAEAIERERNDGGAFISLLDFATRVILPRNAIENLILCGAFDTIEPVRRGLLFGLDETMGTALHIRQRRQTHDRFAFGVEETMSTPTADLPDFDAWDRFLWTWRITGVTPGGHVIAHLRSTLDHWHALTCENALTCEDGALIRTAGLNIRPHRPPTRSGHPVLFTSLEDETSILQTVCVGEALNTCTATLLLSPAVLVEGIIECRGKGASLRIERVRPLHIRKLDAKLHPSVSRAAAEMRPIAAGGAR
jgi:error-prone DNA polymerase